MRDTQMLLDELGSRDIFGWVEGDRLYFIGALVSIDGTLLEHLASRRSELLREYQSAARVLLPPALRSTAARHRDGVSSLALPELGLGHIADLLDRAQIVAEVVFTGREVSRWSARPRPFDLYDNLAIWRVIAEAGYGVAPGDPMVRVASVYDLELGAPRRKLASDAHDRLYPSWCLRCPSCAGAPLPQRVATKRNDEPVC